MGFQPRGEGVAKTFSCWCAVLGEALEGGSRSGQTLFFDHSLGKLVSQAAGEQESLKMWQHVYSVCVCVCVCVFVFVFV